MADAKQIEKVRAGMPKVYNRYQTNQISTDGFGKLYRPLEKRERSAVRRVAKHFEAGAVK